LGAAWRARHSVSIRRDSLWSPYSEDWPDLRSRRTSASATARLTNTPSDFRNGRVFRAYDSKYNIIDAQALDGSEPEVVIESLFKIPETAFVDVRSVYPRLLYLPG
jgi:hypothetical protein